MMKGTARLALGAILALSGVAGPSAKAAYVVTFSEDGHNVVETGSGALDVTDLTPVPPDIRVIAQITPGVFAFSSGALLSSIEVFRGRGTGPSSFGDGLLTLASDSDGGGVALVNLGLVGFLLSVPEGYASGTALSDNSTYLNTSFSRLGVTPGSYTYSWGSDDHADTFTIQIGSVVGAPVPETSTWAMMLLGFAGLGYAALRSKCGVEIWGPSQSSGRADVESRPL